ncbi:MAG: hypothetical protein HON98_06065 [Chloroflexi bacterium]|nr:hypothetical protein [Chloroflexota bacterium]MBT4003007.1 hypothetical protein [Chloroflexota bacterium]MBT4533874.1 hypothetical protein [Chloroflexota bacterium]MBT4681880.1 hypothetical protein [Chloroflexota bacterium]MBT4755234.1 hypothetical protein [Chloroflexota bacterium]
MVYRTSLFPILIIGVLYLFNIIPNWVISVYVVSFLLCAFGWEIWFTYGIWGGLNVNDRRPKALNKAIPQNINWILNSLADAASICLIGLLLVWAFYGFTSTPFASWHWGAFVILFVWFVGQNIYVEAIVYRDQLDDDKPLSWGPLTPGGPWWNPTIFKINGSPIKFQTQIPWVLMTPIFYWVVLYFFQ